MAVWLTLALGYVFGGVVAFGLGLLHCIEDGQIANFLGGGAAAAVVLANVRFGAWDDGVGAPVGHEEAARRDPRRGRVRRAPWLVVNEQFATG